MTRARRDPCRYRARRPTAARRRRPVQWAVLVALVALGPTPLAGQLRISTTLDTTVVTVGDRVELAVTVEHPANAVVVWPDTIDSGPFEVLDTRVQPMRTEGDRATSSATFSVAAFELGELELPPFEVGVLLADGTQETLRTDRYGVEVVSVGIDESGDIRGIRGPLALPIGTLRLLAWALLVLLVLGAMYAFWRRLRRRGTEEAGQGGGPSPRSPHEVALEELARLEGSSLLERGGVKEYHIRVSEIIRRYVEDRFGVPALEMTTWEVLGGLESVGVENGLRGDLRSFLDHCDLVKFAKARPDDDASRAALALGRDIVERSAPRSAEEA